MFQFQNLIVYGDEEKNTFYKMPEVIDFPSTLADLDNAGTLITKYSVCSVLLRNCRLRDDSTSQLILNIIRLSKLQAPVVSLQGLASFEGILSGSYKQEIFL